MINYYQLALSVNNTCDMIEGVYTSINRFIPPNTEYDFEVIVFMEHTKLDILKIKLTKVKDDILLKIGRHQIKIDDTFLENRYNLPILNNLIEKMIIGERDIHAGIIILDYLKHGIDRHSPFIDHLKKEIKVDLRNDIIDEMI